MGEVDGNKLRKTSEALGVDKLLDGSLMNLSNGQQRRARIVKALLQDPEILLLDEPYSTYLCISTNIKWDWMFRRERLCQHYFQTSLKQLLREFS